MKYLLMADINFQGGIKKHLLLIPNFYVVQLLFFVIESWYFHERLNRRAKS